MKPFTVSFAAAAAAVALLQFPGVPANAQSVTPSPSPAASAAPSAAPAYTPSTAKAKPTPAPPKDAASKRVGISGVWEIQIQSGAQTIYTHFKLKQTGNVLIGEYLDTNGKKYPLAGTIQGKEVRVVVTMPNETDLVFEGEVEGGTDMAGTLTNANNVVGFTGAYRPKYNWADNINPAPGGLGGGIP